MRQLTLALLLLGGGCGGSLSASDSAGTPPRAPESDGAAAPERDATVVGSKEVVADLSDGGSSGAAVSLVADPPPDGEIVDPAAEAVEAGWSPCPSALPSAGQACSPPYGGVLVCEYGGDARGLCRTLAECRGGHWSVLHEPCAADPSMCPSAYGAAATCLLPTAICDYPEGRCACVGCSPDADGGLLGGSWRCRPWQNAGAQCPSYGPPLGSACAPEGTTCGDACCAAPSLGQGAVCRDGFWQPVGCTADCLQEQHCR
jgi:hypothetical protein